MNEHVNVIVELMSGIIENVSVFKDDELAKEYVISCLQDLNIDVDATSTIEDILDELDSLSEHSDDEIHWFSRIPIK